MIDVLYFKLVQCVSILVRYNNTLVWICSEVEWKPDSDRHSSWVCTFIAQFDLWLLLLVFKRRLCVLDCICFSGAYVSWAATTSL